MSADPPTAVPMSNSCPIPRRGPPYTTSASATPLPSTQSLARWALAAAAASGVYYAFKRINQRISLGAAIFSQKWFSEFSPMWPGQAFSLQVDEVLFDGHSEYQHIQVFNCGPVWGRVLVLDGVIQCTEKDECAYQEMMAHVPIVSHPKPVKVLVIGGGDGGVLREIARHKGIKEIHICELDQMVIDVSKKHLPSLACGYADPRVQVHVMDGFKFLESRKNEFDVIITDSSDPVGPAEVLFKQPFYEAAKEALTPEGILCCQGECMWLHQDVIKGVKDFATRLFGRVEYGTISLPTYPCGTIGMLCCSKTSAHCCSAPSRLPESKQSDLTVIPGFESEGLKYYNAKIHRAAFVLPTFLEKTLA